MSRSLAEAIGDLGDVDNTSAAERHIVRRACVLIVELERWNAGSPSRRGHAVLPGAGRRIVGRHHLDLDAGLAVQPRNVATQTEGSIIYALGHVLREKITIRNGRVLDSRRGFDPATPRSGELAISPYDLGDDGCRSADDQRTILRPVPRSRFPQWVENAKHLHTLLHQAQAHPSIGAAGGFFRRPWLRCGAAPLPILFLLPVA
jgi:hypothetical protein